MNLTESWVVLAFEVLDGKPDTLFLTHSLDGKKFMIISEGVNVSESSSGSIFVNYIFDIYEDQYFQLIAYEKYFQSSTDCSAIAKYNKSN